MAADTALKRLSVIWLSQPWGSPSYPVGGSAGARAANLHLYAMEGGVPPPPTFTAAGYIGGTALDETGVMGTIFLSDGESVPAGAHFLGGIAHSDAGLRYVCLWPSSDVVYVMGSIARRVDGAMVIAPSGIEAARPGGIAMTYRGEVITSDSAVQIIHNKLGLRTTGALCVSESA